MPDPFLVLGTSDRADVLLTHSARIGRSAQILEKDVWVCWVLDALFTMPGALPMAFKGGTSLSKVYDAIDRFSEDVDITIDYRHLDNSVDLFDASMSRNRQDATSRRLRDLVKVHIEEVVVPHLQTRLSEEFGLEPKTVRYDDENVWVDYPNALQDRGEYVNDSVKLEFGGRNSIDPNERHHVAPYLSVLETMTFPRPMVTVLAAERTFWEKATLIHSELNRAEFRSRVDRLSRHWYDLDQLALRDIGKKALGDRALLEDVVRVKKAFYRSSTAKYDLCIAGELRLIPADDAVTQSLAQDYDEMIKARMFYDEPPNFDEILQRLEAIERSVNAAFS